MDINELKDYEIQTLFCLYYSKMNEDNDDFKCWTDDKKLLKKLYGVETGTLNNIYKALTAKRNRTEKIASLEDEIKNFIAQNDSLDISELKQYRNDLIEIIKKEIEEIEKEKNRYKHTCISLKCGFVDTVHELVNHQADVTISGVYTLSEALEENRVILITLGGDDGKKEVDWTPGFFGIGHVSKAPYDYEEKENNTYFKFDIHVDCEFGEIYKRTDFLLYMDAFDATFIGPELTRDQTQALGSIVDIKAATVIRGVLDRQPELLDKIKELFPEEFVSLILKPARVFHPETIDYGDEKINMWNMYVSKGGISIEETQNFEDLFRDWLRSKKKIDKDGNIQAWFTNKWSAADLVNSLRYLDVDDNGNTIPFYECKNIAVIESVCQQYHETPREELKTSTEQRRPRALDLYIEFFNSLQNDVTGDYMEENGISLETCYETKVNIKINNKKIARNRVVFGAPGTGKSYRLRKECEVDLNDQIDGYDRVTFYQDYTYAQFIGAYKPTKSGDGISYEFVPGPFIRTYVKAIKSAQSGNPKPYVLIIEEINRAKAAAVFGEIFQLLDRDAKGISQYDVQISEDLRKYFAKPDVFGGKPDDYESIRIPDNMYIWATMNSADQGVFPIDTAFKRRWSFEYIGVDDEELVIDKDGNLVNLVSGVFEVKGNKYDWNIVRRAINAKLSSENIKVHEDKLMGPFFLDTKDMERDENNAFLYNDDFIEEFKSKVLMYLFEDAAKAKRPALFGEWIKKCDRYSYLCEKFDNEGLSIFGSDFDALYREQQDNYSKKIEKE